jgi:hypothetical protein
MIMQDACRWFSVAAAAIRRGCDIIRGPSIPPQESFMNRPTPESEISDFKSQIPQDPKSQRADASPDGASFAETALRLGGKSDEEARRTGAIDKADEQVEALFAA